MFWTLQITGDTSRHKTETGEVVGALSNLFWSQRQAAKNTSTPVRTSLSCCSQRQDWKEALISAAATLLVKLLGFN